MSHAAMFSLSSGMASPTSESVYSEWHHMRVRKRRTFPPPASVRPTPVAVWEDSKELKLQPDARLLRDDSTNGAGRADAPMSNDADNPVFTVSGTPKMKFGPHPVRRSLTRLGAMEIGKPGVVREGWSSPIDSINLASIDSSPGRDVTRPQSFRPAASTSVETAAGADTAGVVSTAAGGAGRPEDIPKPSNGADKVSRSPLSRQSPPFAETDAVRYKELQKEWQTSVSREVAWEESVQKSLNKWAVDRARLEEEMAKRNEAGRLLFQLPKDAQNSSRSESSNKPRDPIVDLHEMFLNSEGPTAAAATTMARPMSAFTPASTSLPPQRSFTYERMPRPASSSGQFNRHPSEMLVESQQAVYIHMREEEEIPNCCIP
ncbi:hypothetical protein CBR_g974 [Chara braunii]|uniref:Uncharacterized protein n=1 Tax=Chara braunii TaxID=69332 RepID=A0A388KD25_CHABU|nr:hypothetical protein CBR_g974 [Chara braunii]|eukprot:GBG67853.1 hypothetical protein CBR_g974 [Chara braunii]